MRIETKSVVSQKGDITLYTLTNNKGASVVLSNLGCGIVSVNVPDREGNLADVAIGYADATSYYYDGPCAGKVPGRYANRIAKGHLEVEGKTYQLAINNGPNALHGGPEGFQNQIWDSAIEDGKVVFTRTSPDGEENYPGELKVKVIYSWNDDCELELQLIAVTDKTTVVNLTNHAYFNLAGENSGSIFDHQLWLGCSHYLPTDDTLIPTGEIAPVAGTPMDFTQAKAIGRDIKTDFPALKYGKGYDNCWVIDGGEPGQLQEAAELRSEESGRCLKVYTTQPGVQVYTGNWLSGCPVGKCGRSYEDYEGVALECQNFPDSPNKADYPSPVLRPDETYEQAIIFAFSVE
ncbi:MAG: aldose epimerase family protein [Candidatus Cryptobacteroides sp.]|nr:aldose epimerase family protein [Candidatus Cryptobacteroides sp.]